MKKILHFCILHSELELILGRLRCVLVVCWASQRTLRLNFHRR